MINELKNGFLVAYRILMCLPLVVAWMLLYGLIAISYGLTRADMFVVAWNAFASRDIPSKKELCGCG